jgi:NADH-dependent peroxiredoxin subunit F
MIYDLIIVGGGPGAVAAGVYAARKKINAALVAESFGGQSIVSNDIQNWVGTKSVSGYDLAQMFEEHLRHQEDIAILDGELVTKVEESPAGTFTVSTSKGKTLESKYLLIASGSSRRKLNVPGEAELNGKGVVYCSTCDAPLFKDKVVAIIGGGNAGLEAAVDSLPYASHIYLLEYGEWPKGDPVTMEKLKGVPKFELLTQAQTKEVIGKDFVNSLKYLDRRTNEEKTLDVQGVFVEIGAVPNSEFVKHLVETNKMGEIVVDHKTQKTSHPRIWAVGDVSDVLYKQNNISAGDAVKALLNIYEAVHKDTPAPVAPPAAVPAPPQA